MNLDETLEIDTIIKNSNQASNPIEKVSASGDYQFNGIETHISIFEPQDAGIYEFEINGQNIKIEVIDLNTLEDRSVFDFESSDLSKWDNSKGSIITDIVNQGSYACRVDNNSVDPLYSMPSSGLNNYPEPDRSEFVFSHHSEDPVV